MAKPDGGPAFPAFTPTRVYSSDADRVGLLKPMPIGGMTLRDYFAGQAIVGLLASGKDGFRLNGMVTVIEAVAYHVADAMLTERDKEQ